MLVAILAGSQRPPAGDGSGGATGSPGGTNAPVNLSGSGQPKVGARTFSPRGSARDVRVDAEDAAALARRLTEAIDLKGNVTIADVEQALGIDTSMIDRVQLARMREAVEANWRRFSRDEEGLSASSLADAIIDLAGGKKP